MLSKFFSAINPVFVVLVIWIAFPASGLNENPFRERVSGGDRMEKDAIAKDEMFDYSLELLDLKGNKIKMEQFKGKVIFLNEWATWCGPCRAEMPNIQKLYDDIPKENVVFVMLSRDQAEDTPKIIRYITSKSFSFPVYQPTGDLPKQLNSPSIPATWLISKQGKIVKKEIGIINPSEFKALMETESAK